MNVQRRSDFELENSTKESVKVGSLLVSLACLDSVALSAHLLEDLGSLVDVSHGLQFL